MPSVDAESGGPRRWPGLQGPIAKALNPSKALQAPVVSEHKVGGVTAHSVRLSPTVDLTYAIEGSTLVVATDPAAVKQLASGEGGLDARSPSIGRPTGFPARSRCSAI